MRIRSSERKLGTACGVIALLAAALAGPTIARAQTRGSNPIVRDRFTADPAPLVVGDTLYLYTGHDAAKNGEMFNMPDWQVFSTKDMKTWTAHGPVMKPTDFKWATKDAWAAQTVQKDGKFYFYCTVQHDKTHPGKAIGVAVSDSPTGPFVDARGSALVTDDMTPSLNAWDDIDPTVLMDDDGTAWLCWGNPNCHLAKLKPNMTELDGPVQTLFVPNYTEGPWLSKRNGLYYLTYAAFAHQGMSERICYATADKITGPWTYRGEITGAAKNSYTIHPGLIDFKGQSYFFYHYAALTLPDGQTGALGRRAVCVEYLYYNPDGTIRPIRQTAEGVSVPPTPAAAAAKPDVKPDTGPTDAGVVVTADTAPGTNEWPGTPLLTTVDQPRAKAIGPESFRGGNASVIGQTFVPDKDVRLGRVALYAGDGFDTAADNPITVSLYDVGSADAQSPASYAAGENLLGAGRGLKVAYSVQAPGLLQLDLKGQNQVALHASHRYVLELQGKANAPTLYWRRTMTDAYPAGAAYGGRKLLTDRNQRGGDFALALYAADAPRT